MNQYIKRFAEWLKLKQQLEAQHRIPPIFKDGEVWWCYIGENLGSEISGKSNLFTRPVLILRKYDQYSFYGLPLTTKYKEGTWYMPIKFGGKCQIIVLTQGRRFDYRRLQKKIGQIPEIYLTIARFAHAGLHSSTKKKTYIRIQ
jgi:mRNA interferase MazF